LRFIIAYFVGQWTHAFVEKKQWYMLRSK
jgi:hypothetical protein